MLETKNGEILFLVDGEFICGDSCQIFQCVTYANSQDSAEKKVEKYFRNYYGEEDFDEEIDRFDYLYCCGAVRVKIRDIREATIEKVIESQNWF